MGFKIQSTKSPWFLEERVDSFLVQFRDTLVDMTEEDLEAKKEGLATLKSEKPENLYEEGTRFWGDIFSGYYDFLRSVWIPRPSDVD